MYIAMNRFKVLKDAAQDFENVWYNRRATCMSCRASSNSIC
jgi:heme-degrading monooxygenase HmoA